MRKTNLRLLLTLAPVLVLGTIAVSLSESIEPADWRFVLLFTAVGSVAAASWRVGAAALGGTLMRAHGVPHRLSLVARSERRQPLANRETGLHHDWYFRLRVDEEIARSRRTGQPFTIIGIMADGSDRHSLEIAIARTLRHSDFSGDLGHQLVICLPATTRSGAWVLVTRMTDVSRGLHIKLAEYPADGETLPSLLNDARDSGIQDFAA